MTKEIIKNWILENGQEIHVDMSFRILIHDTNHLYFVKKGELDLFVLDPIGMFADYDDSIFEEMSQSNKTFLGDLLVGPLHFFCHVGPDQLMFPFPLTPKIHPFKVIAKANTNVTVVKIPIMSFAEFIDSSKECQSEFIETHVKEWILKLTKSFRSFIPELECEDVHEGVNRAEEKIKKMTLPKHRSTIHHVLLGWAVPIQGEILFFDRVPYPPLKEGMMIPFTSDVWMTLLEGSAVEFYSEKPETFGTRAMIDSLLLFQQVLVVGAKEIDIEAKNNEVIEIVERAETAEKRKEVTIDLLGNILEPTAVFHIREMRNKLFQAFEVITNTLEKKLYIPAKIQDKSEEDQIYTITVASKIYTRVIKLRKNWRTNGSLPLLTHQIRGEEREPVAVLTNSDGLYESVDAENRFQRKEVDSAFEAKTEPKATMFYQALPEKTDLTPLELLKYFSKSNVKDILMIIAISFFSMVVGVITPFFNRMIFDSVIPSSDILLLFQILFWMFIILLFQMILGYARTFAIMRFETLFSHNLDMSIWIRLMNLPYSFFRKYSSGDLYSRINAVSGLKNIVTGHAISLTLDAFFSVVYLFVMIYFSPMLTFVTLGVLVLMTLVDIFALTKSVQFSRETQKISGDLYGQVMQVIVGISKIKIYGVESRIFSYWADAFVNLTKISIKGAKLGMWISTINATLSTLMSYTLMIGMTLIKFLEKPSAMQSVTIGEFMAFSAAFGTFTGYYFSVVSALQTYISIIPTWERCKVILEEKPEVFEENLLNIPLRGKIEFKNVYFRYDHDAPYVHDDISLKAEPGEFIAIVGRSGCGKSSLIQLLLGFEKPEMGGIFLDDKELSSFDIQNVRSQMGVVSQNCKIIDGTIRDNITGGKVFTREEVMEAAKIAEFDHFINQLPMELQTFLTHGSETLSGGQMQRLFLTRAIIGTPKILILDEATNALDNETQMKIMEHIDKLRVTRIVIAHRLSTTMNADRIYVMKEGKIMEVGTYEELIKNKGYFSRLVELQAL